MESHRGVKPAWCRCHHACGNGFLVELGHLPHCWKFRQRRCDKCAAILSAPDATEARSAARATGCHAVSCDTPGTRIQSLAGAYFSAVIAFSACPQERRHVCRSLQLPYWVGSRDGTAVQHLFHYSPMSANLVLQA